MFVLPSIFGPQNTPQDKSIQFMKAPNIHAFYHKNTQNTNLESFQGLKPSISPYKLRSFL